MFGNRGIDRNTQPMSIDEQRAYRDRLNQSRIDQASDTSITPTNSYYDQAQQILSGNSQMPVAMQHDVPGMPSQLKVGGDISQMKTPNDFLNDFLNKSRVDRFQDIANYVTDDKDPNNWANELAPWKKHAIINRSTSQYGNWLAKSDNFTLNGKNYQWVQNGDESTNLGNNITQTGDFLNDKMYTDLIRMKNQATGGNYIPIQVN